MLIWASLLIAKCTILSRLVPHKSIFVGPFGFGWRTKGWWSTHSLFLINYVVAIFETRTPSGAGESNVIGADVH